MRLGTKKLLAALLWVVLGTVAQTIGGLVGFGVAGSDLGLTLGSVMVMAVCMVLAVLALGGRDTLSLSRSRWAIAWHAYRAAIAVAALLLAISMVEVVAEGEGLVANWAWQLGVSAIAMLCVGVGEELLFRGLLLGGPLARFGGTKGGVVACVVASSLLFGLAHIDFLGVDASDPLQLLQAVLKVAQTGLGGFALAVGVLEGSGLLWPAMLHALDDFILTLPSALYEPNMWLDVEYVAGEADEGLQIVLVYVVVIALYLPMAIRAARRLRALGAPCFGPLAEGLTPQDALCRDAKPRTDEGGRPPAPVGWRA